MTSVGIVGLGWVGGALQKLFPEARVCDTGLRIGSRALINSCDITFIAVPTPNPGEGRLDISAVEEVVSWCESPLLVIRSTVNPGDCDRLAQEYDRRIVHQPEYLGESPAHPFADMRTRQFMIIGGEPRDRRHLIDLYTEVYNADIAIRQMSLLEAEIVKLSENRAISMKVAQVQELYDACEAAGVDFYTIREAVYGDDPRQNRWFTFVYPEKRGMSSKCIPKDVFAWASWAESVGASASVTRAILERNREWVRSSQRREEEVAR